MSDIQQGCIITKEEIDKIRNLIRVNMSSEQYYGILNCLDAAFGRHLSDYKICSDDYESRLDLNNPLTKAMWITESDKHDSALISHTLNEVLKEFDCEDISVFTFAEVKNRIETVRDEMC